MVKLYFNLLKNGFWSIDNVPNIWREEVRALLDKEV